ncbi:MAG: hypothetical protein RLZZ414_353 [Bacteroidota bacterium]|jgi:hypothetical protein
MKKILSIATTIIVLATTISCKRERLYEAKGQVLNAVTGEPVVGAKVYLNDELGNNDPILSSDGIENSDVALTDNEGRYHVKIMTKSGKGIISVGKSGYEFNVYSENGNVVKHWTMIGEGTTNLNLILEGIAYFNSPFYKTSAPQKDQDSLKITLLSYEDLNIGLRSLGTKLHKGKGSFTFFNDGDESGIITKGDSYLRYKLEFTTDGVWQTKIDSVFLPTSLEVIRDTIYY